MPSDTYAVLRALLRAEALRSTPKTETDKAKPQQQPVKRARG
ncbi:hypothetical protein [Streptomyces sp. NPDC001508]